MKKKNKVQSDAGTLSINEVASEVGVSRVTISRWISLGMPAIWLNFKQRGINPVDVLKWLKSGDSRRREIANRLEVIWRKRGLIL